MNPEELLEIAERIVGWGRDGEQIEAVVGHSQETDVRVYEGEIESLSVAESQGVGIRVIADNRQGFAHAGTLDPAVLEETLAEARDNAVFGSPDEFFGLAEPDGVDPPVLNLYNEALLGFGTEAKIDLALELERAVLAGDSRIVGVESADYGDALSADAIATTTGIRSTGRDTSCYVTAYSLASEGERDPDRVRVLGGVESPEPWMWRWRPTTRWSAPLGCWGPLSPQPSGSPWCSTRSSPPSFWA